MTTEFASAPWPFWVCWVPKPAAAHDTLKALARDSKDAGIRQQAERAVQSVSVKDELTSKDPATRIAAAETVGGLAWRAGPALPALIATVKDPEPKVRLAAVTALRSLGKEGEPALTALATALPAETDASVRIAMLETIEAIAPGTRPVIDAHLGLLHPPIRWSGRPPQPFRRSLGMNPSSRLWPRPSVTPATRSATRPLPVSPRSCSSKER